jgi:hypothetical protein
MIIGRVAYLPPSVLPDISPSRGEIRDDMSHASPAFVEMGQSRVDIVSDVCGILSLISPLEGEMVGRPEGGNCLLMLSNGVHP